MFSRTYRGYSTTKDQYKTKLLNLDMFCDEAVLTFDRTTYRNSVTLCMGKDFIHIAWNITGMKFICRRNNTLIYSIKNW